MTQVAVDPTQLRTIAMSFALFQFILLVMIVRAWNHQWVRLGLIVANSLGLGFGIYLWCSFPSNAEQTRIYSRSFPAKGSDVARIEVGPVFSRNSPLNLVTKRVVIDDPGEVDDLCRALREVMLVTGKSGHKWSCSMVLCYEDGKKARMRITQKSETMVTVRYGWYEQGYQCDSLGPLLERMTQQR